MLAITACAIVLAVGGPSACTGSGWKTAGTVLLGDVPEVSYMRLNLAGHSGGSRILNMNMKFEWSESLTGTYTEADVTWEESGVTKHTHTDQMWSSSTDNNIGSREPIVKDFRLYFKPPP